MKPGGGPALAGIAVAAVALVAVVAVATHGFRDTTACAAVAFSPLVVVRIVGDPAAVHDVRLCTTAGCSAPAATSAPAAAPSASPAPAGTAAPAETPAPVPPVGTTATPRPGSAWTGVTPPADPVSVPQFSGYEATTPGRWAFSGVADHPAVVSATAYGDDGRELASRTVTLDWHDQDPGAACPTGEVADPVTLRVAP